MEERDGVAADTSALFTSVFHNSADPMVITRLSDGTYRDVNEAFVQMSGRPRSEIVGLTSLDLDWVDPADREEMVGELRVHGRTQPRKGRFRDVEGTPRVGIYSAQVIDYGGEPCVLATIRDVTDYERVSQELAEREERLTLLTENMPGILWTTDQELVVTSTTGAGLATMGASAADFMGRGLRDVLAGDPERIAVLDRVLETGEPYRHETIWMGRAFEVYLAPVRIAGEVVGMMGAAIDITYRKEAQETSQKYTERLHALYDIEQAILSAKGAEAIAEDATGRLRRLVGYDRASVLEFDSENQLAITLAISFDGPTSFKVGEGLPLMQFGAVEAFRRGEARRFDDLTKAEDLTEPLARLASEGIRTYLNVPLIAEGELIGSLNLGSFEPDRVTAEDLEIAREVAAQMAIAIQQARLQERLRLSADELQERLEELKRTAADRKRLLGRLVRAQEEERQRIAADIHDDSLQKIAAVGLRFDVLRKHLKDPEISEEAGRLADTVRSSIDRLRHLMFELWPAALERHGLAEAIKVDLAAMRDEQGIEFRVDDRMKSDLPVDLKTITYRIVQEAISNIRKHADARHATVTLEESQGGIRVHVKDDGKGMPVDASAGSPPGHLGIPAMRERADLAGGWLRVESAPGSGVRIEFWIPVET